ncbi:hypothetical protein DdX_18656 [Ditylenchus destructor]|uniref:Uncharacterized protein n=1 Tax=Ditylenchus destructor TaxID=166010 RepID=A0AAD4ML54_9BILA|nr:hypothetical protein DdX_18656 [Ditylenchus destructor]
MTNPKPSPMDFVENKTNGEGGSERAVQTTVDGKGNGQESINGWGQCPANGFPGENRTGRRHLKGSELARRSATYKNVSSSFSKGQCTFFCAFSVTFSVPSLSANGDDRPLDVFAGSNGRLCFESI